MPSLNLNVFMLLFPMHLASTVVVCSAAVISWSGALFRKHQSLSQSPDVTATVSREGQVWTGHRRWFFLALTTSGSAFHWLLPGLEIWIFSHLSVLFLYIVFLYYAATYDCLGNTYSFKSIFSFLAALSHRTLMLLLLLILFRVDNCSAISIWYPLCGYSLSFLIQHVFQMWLQQYCCIF